MDFLVKALLTALVASGVGWLIVDLIAVREGNSGPRRPSSGAETAIGRLAVVTKAFSVANGGEVRGRVRFDGEDWKAVFAGDASEPPTCGDRVTVTEIDTGALEVRVK